MVQERVLPKINVEKNKLALEQAEATMKQLKATYELKRRAADADIRILQIRRDRAASAERQAAGQRRAHVDSRPDRRHGGREDDLEGQQHGGGAGRGRSPRRAFRSSTSSIRTPCGCVRESTRPTSTNFRSARPVRVGLDAYPALSFDGRIAQISPLGVTSVLSPKVRTLRRAGRRQRRAPEPDAGPVGVA